MMRTLLVLFFCTLLLPLTGQQNSTECNSDSGYVAFLQVGMQGFEYNNAVEKFEGSPFFNKWTLGEVMLMNGDVITDIYLRYEMYLDALLWLRVRDYKIGIMQKQEISGFSLFDAKGGTAATFVRKKYKSSYEPDSTDAFFHVLVAGDLTLYAYRRVSESPNAYRLIEDTKYMLGSGDEMLPLVLKRQALLSHPLVDKTKMKSVLRSGGMMISEGEWDMVRAITLYNSMQ